MSNIFGLPDNWFCVVIKDFLPASCSVLLQLHTGHIAHHKIISVPQQAPPGAARLRLFSWPLLQGMVSELGSKRNGKVRNANTDMQNF